jgi:transposase
MSRGDRDVEVIRPWDAPRRSAEYFGLAPSQDESGVKNQLGHITRAGAAVVSDLATSHAGVEEHGASLQLHADGTQVQPRVHKEA